MNHYNQLTKEELLLLLQQRDNEIETLRNKTTDKSDSLFNNYRDLLDLIPMGIEWVDPDGYVIDYNHTLAEMFALTRETGIGANRFQVIPQEYVAAIQSGQPYEFNLYTNGVSTYSQPIDGNDTEYGLFLIRVTPVYDDYGKLSGYLSIIEDRTSEHKKEMAIRENERIVNLFRFALSQSPSETYALDINGKIIFANPLAIQRYGLSYPLEKHSFSDVDPYFGLANWQAAMRNMKVGVSHSFHTSHSLPDGTVIPLEIESYKTTDEVNGDLYWSFCLDVTERNKQTDRINSLNRLMDTILNNVPVVIHVENADQDFRYIYFNEEAERFYNISAQNIIGQTVDFLYPDHKDIADSIHAEYEETFKKGSVSNYAVNYVKPNGDIRIVNSTRMLVESDEGKLIVSFIWDITEKRENEVELMRIRQADKMKSAFLANMSHEIRTPLNAIVGFSGIIKEVEDEDERQHLIDIIEYNNELLLKLIGDILDVSKIEANEMDFDMQTVDLKEVCRKAIMSNAIRINPRLKVLFDEELLPSVWITTDVTRITQVLSNLITNANKFTEQGSITIAYGIDEASGMVRISVTDTGTGIPKAQQSTIFDRFVKLNEEKQGTGLGLSISKMIVQKLGGEIGVLSEPGKGSTFWFTHPVN